MVATYIIIELDAAGRRIDDYDDTLTAGQLAAYLENAVEKIEFRDFTGYKFGGDARVYSYVCIGE
jgi:hypothetical protein